MTTCPTCGLPDPKSNPYCFCNDYLSDCLSPSVYSALSKMIEDRCLPYFCDVQIPTIWVRPHLKDVGMSKITGEIFPIWKNSQRTVDTTLDTTAETTQPR